MREHQLQQPGTLFLLRNPLVVASRTMRRGIRGFCHGVGSTSTQQHLHASIDHQQLASGGADADAASSSFMTVPSSVVGSCAAESEATTGGGPHAAAAVTLEQMILQLDLEEEAAAARKARRVAAAVLEEDRYHPRRMSCVNSSDHVLRSARDALSQYPRFSLDGRDAMCRASFSSYHEGMGVAGPVLRDSRNIPADRDGSRHRRASVCCAAAGAGHCRAKECGMEGYEMDLERTLRMPSTVAGESVVWCKPGVVAKLMGLDSVPVPIGGGQRGGIAGARRKANWAPQGSTLGGGVRKQRSRRMGIEELEKERLFMALHGYLGSGASALRATAGPDVSGFGRDGEGWEFRVPS
ncbi:uncharacterized protein LOC125548268 [Triticum urartu]|uniref:uncharacterized protein LOC125548268 n=1 Tax=Triticum urartu TaxID=4572 RepID=UPI00204441DA|nr:uncharacterized protein LOC125548268 [Triticum urartu]